MKVALCVSTAPQQTVDKKLKYRLSPRVPPQAHLPGREDRLGGVQPPAEGSRLGEVTSGQAVKAKNAIGGQPPLHPSCRLLQSVNNRDIISWPRPCVPTLHLSARFYLCQIP